MVDGDLKSYFDTIHHQRLRAYLEEFITDKIVLADDFVIYMKTPRAGERVMASVKKYIEEDLCLTINEKKSKVYGATNATFQVQKRNARIKNSQPDYFSG